MQCENLDSASKAWTAESGKVSGVYMMMRGVEGEYLLRVCERRMAPARYEGRVRRVAYTLKPVGVADGDGIF